MTRDDIIRLAREASSEPDYDFPNISALERFAALVAAAEREACALVADEEFGSTLMIGDAQPKHSSAWRIAAAIRARGETK
jgi:hypothetical protein